MVTHRDSKRSETVDLWDTAAFPRQEEHDRCHTTCSRLLFTAQDNDVIVARAKWPATGDEQTDGEQSHRLGQRREVVVRWEW